MYKNVYFKYLYKLLSLKYQKSYIFIAQLTYGDKGMTYTIRISKFISFLRMTLEYTLALSSILLSLFKSIPVTPKLVSSNSNMTRLEKPVIALLSKSAIDRYFKSLSQRSYQLKLSTYKTKNTMSLTKAHRVILINS